MKKVLSDDSLFCTGCSACFNACPCDAIVMSENDNGSLVALINEERCTDCGKCEKVCPLLRGSQESCVSRKRVPELYAIWASGDIRLDSTSGGAFSLIADEVFSGDGVVYAVVFDKDFRAVFRRFTKEDDLSPARGSKYVQSNPADSFLRVRNDLNQGTLVCYVGLPCQVAGLNSFLEKEYDNLITVDMLCNFAPPYTLFRKYLEEDLGFSDIASIRFRSKEFGWVADVCRVTYQDESISFRRESNDYFQKGYHQKLYMPYSCEHCHFSGYPKQGDITLGDFWYIEEYDAPCNDGAGTSVFLINSEKGKVLFRGIEKKAVLCKEMPLSTLDKNRPLVAEPHSSRDRFYALLKQYSFDKAVDYALNGKYDVGVLGVWSEDNYGSEITYYALYRFLKKHGYEVVMIERPAQSPWPPNEVPVLFNKNPYDEKDLCTAYASVDGMHDLNNRCDAFVLGSDQMWHDNLFMPFGQYAYLDYIHENKNKIAYATSFGKATWDGTKAQRDLLSFYLKRLNSISVRERTGVEICRDVFGCTAEWNLDPVFLCDKEIYAEIATKRNSDTKYIGSYLLDVTKEKQDAMRWISAEKGFPLEIITDARNPRESLWSLPVNIGASEEDWLSLFINAECIVTDSFHGMCFATLFHKPFIAFVNETRGSTRFLEYAELLNLGDRIIWNPADIEARYRAIAPIDWNHIDSILEAQKELSSRWLLDAINKDNNAELSLFDVLGDRMASVKQLDSQVTDNAGMIQHHENVFRDVYSEINDLRVDLEEFKGSLRKVSGLLDNMRKVKRKFR